MLKKITHSAALLMLSLFVQGCLTSTFLRNGISETHVQFKQIEGVVLTNNNEKKMLIVSYDGCRLFDTFGEFKYYYSIMLENNQIPKGLLYSGNARDYDSLNKFLENFEAQPINHISDMRLERISARESILSKSFTKNTREGSIYSPNGALCYGKKMCLIPIAWKENNIKNINDRAFDDSLDLNPGYQILMLPRAQPLTKKDIALDYSISAMAVPFVLVIDTICLPFYVYYTYHHPI